MSDAFVRASRVRVSAAHISADAGFRLAAVPDRSTSRQLRPSQHSVRAPFQGAVIQSDATRPSQIAMATSGISAAMPPVSHVADGSSAGLRPSQGGLRRDSAGAAKLCIQRCGIGSSCDCSPRDKLAGIEHDLQRATAAGGARTPAGTSLPGAALAVRMPPRRPSQVPVASTGKDGNDLPRYTLPVLDVVGEGGGQPLDPVVRADMETRLGSDFSSVRIHTGHRAAKSAAAVSATAYTVGNDVVFGHGYFDPASREGRHRLVHELVHVQQQRHGPVPGTDTGGGVAISDPADSLEREAEAIAARVAASPPLANGRGPRDGHQQLQVSAGNQAVAELGTSQGGQPIVQRTIGDGHDLCAPQFAGDIDLEAAYDDEARITMNGMGMPGKRQVERGTPVSKVQKALVDLGYSAVLDTGTYDQPTWDAVKDIKKSNGLGWENMGDVGPGTMDWLNKHFTPPCPRSLPSPPCPPCEPSPCPEGTIPQGDICVLPIKPVPPCTDKDDAEIFQAFQQAQDVCAGVKTGIDILCLGPVANPCDMARDPIIRNLCNLTLGDLGKQDPCKESPAEFYERCTVANVDRDSLDCDPGSNQQLLEKYRKWPGRITS